MTSMGVVLVLGWAALSLVSSCSSVVGILVSARVMVVSGGWGKVGAVGVQLFRASSCCSLVFGGVSTLRGEAPDIVLRVAGGIGSVTLVCLVTSCFATRRYALLGV